MPSIINFCTTDYKKFAATDYREVYEIDNRAYLMADKNARFYPMQPKTFAAIAICNIFQSHGNAPIRAVWLGDWGQLIAAS